MFWAGLRATQLSPELYHNRYVPFPHFDQGKGCSHLVPGKGQALEDLLTNLLLFLLPPIASLLLVTAVTSLSPP